MQLLRILASLLVTVTTAALPSSASSLCGEQLERETGFINGLYYILFQSSSTAPPQDIPLVLWLSGGPGCSGLVGALFELGPCMYDDEADTMLLNEYSWTNHAHVVFIDQPHGTGFSTEYEHPRRWTERRAMDDLADFVEGFFQNHPALQPLDFYIFGESYGGHYAPDLGATLVRRDASWKTKIHGVGIGNGVVSPIANLQTYLDFAQENKYNADVVGTALVPQLRQQQELAVNLSQQCLEAMRADKPSDGHRRMRALALESANDNDGVYPSVCNDAARASVDFETLALEGVQASARNMYDVRRTCHLSDPLGLCYRFSRFEDYVNQHALEYFGVSGKKWSLCSSTVMRMLWPVEFIEQSDGNVAFLLDHGVRVLVYAGDADTMAPWNMQDRWTHDLEWSGSDAFRSSLLDQMTMAGVVVGEVRSANGLSLVRVYESGHMVPHDQPEFALEMLRSFTREPSSSRNSESRSVFS